MGSYIWAFEWHRQLAHLHLTWTNSKGQGHEHFDSEYLAGGDRYDKINIVIKKQVIYGFSIGIFTFDLGLI